MASPKKSAIDEAMKAPQLSAREKKVRDDFVTELLKDSNPTKAAIRIGYGPSFAHEMAVRFQQEPYVLQQIEERRVIVAAITDAQMKEEVKATLYHAMKSNLCKDRDKISAASKLATIFGMDAPTKTELTGPNGAPLNPVSLNVFFNDEPN